MGDDIRFHVGMMARVVAAREIADLVFELIDRQSGFHGLIVNDGLIGMVLMDVFGSMSYAGSNSFALNNGLDGLVDVVMGLVMDIGSAFNLLSFSGGDILLVGDPVMLLMMTTSIFFRHLGLMMTVFGFEILMFMLRGQRLLVRDRLDPVLVMMNIVFMSDVLVDFLGFLRANRFVSDAVVYF